MRCYLPLWKLFVAGLYLAVGGSALGQVTVPRPSGHLAAPADPIRADAGGNGFQSIGVYNDLFGFPGQAVTPGNEVHTHDVKMRFLQATVPTDPAHPPAFTMGVSSDLVDVTPPGGTVGIFDPGPRGFFDVRVPSDPAFAGDPAGPQTVHFVFSALFLDAVSPGVELAAPSDPIHPADPSFVLLPGGGSLEMYIYHQLSGTGAQAIQHSHFSIDLNELPSDPIRIANVTASRGSLDFGFDVVVDNPAAFNQRAAGSDLFTMTLTGDVESAGVPEPGSVGVVLVGWWVLRRRGR